MELNEIVDTSDAEFLIQQYVEVALTGGPVEQISPTPEQFDRRSPARRGPSLPLPTRMGRAPTLPS